MAEHIHAPWVGDDWESASPRLMLLGDSHYLTDLSDDSTGLTQDIVRSIRDGERRISFYKKAAELAGGKVATTQDGWRAFWNKVVFLNFVPVTVGTAFDAVPTPAMWNAGVSRFVGHLERLEPTHVLSLGQRQWNHIAFPDTWESTSVSGHPDLHYWRTRNDSRIVATWVNHPSSRGFSVAKWSARVNALLDVRL